MMNGTITYQYINSDEFSTRVYQIVNQERFWRDLARSFQIESQIRNETEKQLKYALNGNMLLKIQQTARDEVANIIAGKVAREIQQQLPSYLDQNGSMQNILGDHVERVNRSLEQKVSEILKNIVEDPKYHEINKLYFEAFKRNADAAIGDMKTQAQVVQTDLQQQVTDKLQVITQLQSRISELERITNSQSTYHMVTLVVMGSLLGAVGWLISKK